MRGWWRRLVELVRPGQLDRETAEELAHHVELATARQRESGVNDREARRRALADVGGIAAGRQRERSREIGIRLAVGGRSSHVRGWVAGWGFRLIGCGIAIGFLVARVLGPMLESLLFGVRASDRLTMLAVAGGAAMVGIIGLAGPVWRAMRINPIEVLRN